MPDSPADYQTILYERRGRIGLITLNRPEKLNAWNPRMETEFIDVVNRTAEDRNAGVLVVTGAGRAFCAGGDISGWSEGMTSEGRRPPESPLLQQEGSPEVPIALRRGKPAIAAINGPSIGVGLTMPLACDIRIASDRARFSVRFVKVGLTPEVDRVVPHDDLMDEAMALAEEIAANPGDAVWAAKRLLHENAAEADLRRVVTQEGFAIREMRSLPDHAEAVRAFMEKRDPHFNQG
jgi:enoyl-CoA hydratase/carnithine racemase